jgi:hypothetical protein
VPVVGLLTLLNAPFDWASLGLTRALLRRGLELGGWWPYLLALVDACLAAIIACLALVMVIGVQAFDELAGHDAGKPFLPLAPLFDGIAKTPAAPEYWWAYALLLSSMIPSLVNLAIGGMALTRGIPDKPSHHAKRFIRIKKIVTGGLNIVALRWWIRLKARRRFRKALGAPQSAKIHRPKIKNSHSGNRENRAERRLHVSHQVKNRTQYLHSYVCLLAVVIDFLRCWTVRAPRQTI